MIIISTKKKDDWMTLEDMANVRKRLANGEDFTKKTKLREAPKPEKRNPPEDDPTNAAHNTWIKGVIKKYDGYKLHEFKAKKRYPEIIYIIAWARGKRLGKVLEAFNKTNGTPHKLK